jgi:coenzyme PQQ synthesis protein D (PqqD)
VDGRTRLVIRCEARGFFFDVHGDSELHGILSGLFAALERRAGGAAAVFSVGRAEGDEATWHVRMDGRLMMGCGQLGEALHGLMVHLNQRVVTARNDLLSLHAAAVATPDGAAVLPGSSGSGKTTLCARLLQRGAVYLSDDSVALDRHDRLFGYPKPLGFKAGTWEQFAAAGLADLDLDHGRQLVWQVPPSRLGARSVTSAGPVAVVVPRFESGAALRIEPMSRHAAAAALLGQAQNLLAFGVPAALQIIGRLTARVACHEVVYGDAREAAPAVLDLIGPAPSVVRYEVVPPEVPRGTVTQPFPATDLSVLRFEDGALLVRGVSGEYATLDRAGGRIWPLLDGHRTVESIGAELASLFDAPRSEIESDVACWVSELVDRGFLFTPARTGDPERFPGVP